MPTTTIDARASATVVRVEPTPATWSAIPEGASTEVPAVMTTSQAYYWTRAWQQGEMEARTELRQGKGHVFTEPGQAIRWLLSTDGDED